MRVRFATAADLEPAVTVLRNAARRLETAGMPLWKPEQFSIASLEPVWAAGELCVAMLEDRIVGAMFLQRDDLVFWPDEPSGSSLFVHKLVVDDGWSGRGVSTALLEFARERLYDTGRAWLRLDCADRTKLRAV
jgi:GNAT superfamily N-acetyltransferase